MSAYSDFLSSLLSFAVTTVANPIAGFTAFAQIIRDYVVAAAVENGVTSLGKLGDATKLKGDVDLEEGANVTIVRGAQKLTISSLGGGTTDHAALSHLDYASAGHTGFQPAGSYEVGGAVAAHEGSYDHALLPSSDEKAALAGTDGTPDAGNPYVTDSDPRLAAGGGADVVSVADASLGTINAGNYADFDATGWFDDGIVTLIQLEAASATERTTMEVYGKDSFASGQLIKRVCDDLDLYTYPLAERTPFHYADGDNSQEIHIRIINNGTVNSDYSIIIYGIGK